MKYFIALLFTFLFVVLPLIICRKKDLAIGLTVPCFMAASGTLQAIATWIGI